MKKVIFSQVMTDNGIAEFSGVYDPKPVCP